MELKDFAEIAKDPEGAKALLNVIEEVRESVIPILTLLRDSIGIDADVFVDEALKWAAKKNKVSYDALVQVGFTRDEALSLLIQQNINIGNTMRSIPTQQ